MGSAAFTSAAATADCVRGNRSRYDERASGAWYLNTPRLVADATGTTVWRWDQQEPFGDSPANENPSGAGSFDLPLRLPGQYYDAESALHYNYYRDYDPTLGIYKQSDPIGLRGGIDTYAYVNESPVLFIDLDGLLACTYDISAHTLSCTNYAGQSFSTSVSGSGTGSCKDNPKCVAKPFKGPLPPGVYAIRPPGWSKRRPRWLYLDPSSSNQMFNRGGFFIHPWGISNGCIILHVPNFNIISNWAKQDGGGTLNVGN